MVELTAKEYLAKFYEEVIREIENKEQNKDKHYKLLKNF